MSREILEKKSKKELVGIATDLKITGRWDMTKPQLIEAILGAKSVEENDAKELKSAIIFLIICKLPKITIYWA